MDFHSCLGGGQAGSQDNDASGKVNPHEERHHGPKRAIQEVELGEVPGVNPKKAFEKA